MFNLWSFTSIRVRSVWDYSVGVDDVFGFDEFGGAHGFVAVERNLLAAEDGVVGGLGGGIFW